MSGKKKKSPTVVTSAELESRARGATSDAQIRSKRIHTGKIIKLDSDRIRYPDGSEAEVDIVRHSGASAVVPFLSDPEGEDPQILLLRQYRYAADGYLYEIPAGSGGDPSGLCGARAQGRDRLHGEADGAPHHDGDDPGLH
jgi:hypothetical protein